MRVLYAGTFDRLHDGHKRILNKCVLLVLEGCDYIDGEMSSLIVEIMPWRYCFKFKKHAHLVQRETERFKAVEDYLDELLEPWQYTVTIATDEYGHAFYSKTLTDIVVGEDAEGWATMINHYREVNGLPVLNVHLIADVKTGDGERISSTKLREKEIV